jgi:hypothetical protein
MVWRDGSLYVFMNYTFLTPYTFLMFDFISTLCVLRFLGKIIMSCVQLALGTGGRFPYIQVQLALNNYNEFSSFAVGNMLFDSSLISTSIYE